MIDVNANPQVLEKVKALTGTRFDSSFLISYESFTAKNMSWHWGGDVCYKIPEHKPHAFINTTYAAGIKPVNVR